MGFHRKVGEILTGIFRQWTGWQGAGALKGPGGREQPGGLVREAEADVLGKG